MHVCFRGGAGDSSRVARPISAIRGFTKSMKAMSLKAKPGGRSRRRRPEDVNPGAASAKIAPAQLQDEADDDPLEDHQQRKKKPEFCDKCCSPLPPEDEDEREEEEESGGGGREWVAEPEPGVSMTLAARRDGTNRLRRVRFRAELFDAWAARAWWADNCDRIFELYTVARSDSDEDSDSAADAMPGTPCQSEDDEEPHTPDHETVTPEPGAEESGSSFSGDPSSGSGSGSGSAVTVGSPVLGLVVTEPNNTFETPRTPTTTTESAQDDDDEEDEWVEEYEPGVFLTVRACPDQSLQLRHVELSRERFGEVKARVWWQENKDRLRTFYSF
ncbi:putative protein Brevis radix-like 5 [Brachypodium distachyon]|uniref:BRX domain-containing protein n=1 Tax=Brachypodium distachyon TaxID=15368 RepID=A0A0Q3EWS6_BRADI|nr:putative protein Brevis radix-like 5 [Brachypodium distachyon]KQJ91934.1 hypothetical protein BRADI_4g40660v3 [Brachypodium distachyon]|eukprot:XP_010239476.2 putative protein Brevis radix-like 5 [Brachypodium distachyon]